jgi:hypothetical protein
MILRQADVIREGLEPQFANPASFCIDSGSAKPGDLRLVRYLPGAVIESLSMRIRIYSNETEAPLSSFIGKFLGNVCAAIADSLKIPRPIRTLRYELEGEVVRIQVNQLPVALNMSQGFSRIIVLDTIRGMIRHLKLADPNGAIRIEIDMETEL